MKTNPTMIPAIVLALLAALYACHLTLISDLLLAGVVLALLTVLIATEPEPGEGGPPHTRRQTVSSTSS